MKVSKCGAYMPCGSMAVIDTPKVSSPRRVFFTSCVGIHFAQVAAIHTRTLCAHTQTRYIQRDGGIELNGELPRRGRFVRNHRGSSASEEYYSHDGCASTLVHRAVRAPWYAAHGSG